MDSCYVLLRGCRGRDRITSVHITTKVVSSNPAYGELYLSHQKLIPLLYVTRQENVGHSDSGKTKKYSHPPTKRQVEIVLGLSGYNTKSLTVDYSEQRV